MITVAVRQAVLADLDALTSLFDPYRQFQRQAADVPACRAFLHDRFNHAESVVFLAIAADDPVGFAQRFPSFSATALARVFILNDLFVARTARRARCRVPPVRPQAADAMSSLLEARLLSFAAPTWVAAAQRHVP